MVGADVCPLCAVDCYRFWQLVHTTPSTPEAFYRAITLSKTRQAGYIYVTNDIYLDPNVDNPWDSLPQGGLWDLEVSLIKSPQQIAIQGPYTPPCTTATCTWQRAIGTARIVLANPSSGPGTAVDSAWLSLVKQVTAAGMLMLGYVTSTSLGTLRPAATVKAEINTCAWPRKCLQASVFDCRLPRLSRGHPDLSSTGLGQHVCNTQRDISPAVTPDMSVNHRQHVSVSQLVCLTPAHPHGVCWTCSYFTFYPNVSGIFLDGVTESCSNVAFYQDVVNYIRTSRPNAVVVFNWGSGEHGSTSCLHGSNPSMAAAAGAHNCNEVGCQRNCCCVLNGITTV